MKAIRAPRLPLGIWWHVKVEWRLQNCGGWKANWLQRRVQSIGQAIYMCRRWLEGARSVDTAGGTRGFVDGDGFEIEFSGMCPVQGDGVIDGRACYYRSRGEGWQFYVAAPGSDDVLDDSSWLYSKDPYFFPDGGHVSAAVSERCIREAVAAFRRAVAS